MTTTEPLRIALCGGVLYQRDAISHSLRLKLDAGRRWRAAGEPVEVRAFVLHTDEPAEDVLEVGDAWVLARDPWFASAAVRTYEFGIRYSLLDTLFLDCSSPAIGVFHNVTPIELVDGHEAQAAIADSMRQVHNLDRCTEVLCDSTFNAEVLADLGIDVPTTVLPLPPCLPCPGDRTARADGAPVRVLFIGRLVRSKGVRELLDAFAAASEASRHATHLVLAASTRFSDPGIVDAVTATIADRPGLTLRLALDLDDDALALELASADVLVLPSHHEGYGLPVAEALASGCHVITSDAGALPETVGDLGTVVPVGDVAALTAAIAESIEAIATGGPVPTNGGRLPRDEWRARVEALCAGRSRESYEAAFRAAVERAVER